MNRRRFLRSAAATGAGWLILPSGTLSGQKRFREQAQHRSHWGSEAAGERTTT